MVRIFGLARALHDIPLSERIPMGHPSMTSHSGSVLARRCPTRLFKPDRPRAIDRCIDYFGGAAGRTSDSCGEALLDCLDQAIDDDEVGAIAANQEKARCKRRHGGQRPMTLKPIGGLLCLALLAAGCAGPVASPTPGPRQEAGRPAARPVDPAQAERLQRVMVPLIRAMNHPRSLNQARVGIVEDPNINAANAGGGEFYVTTGLLQKANDEQLLGVLAHEVAHDDLGHLAKAQALGAGLNIGMIILDQLIPGSGAITPIAGALVARGYSRNEEYDADRHGVELLRRIGQPKEVMINTLSWLMQTAGPGGGGFLSTHPATGDRIEALRRLR